MRWMRNRNTLTIFIVVVLAGIVAIGGMTVRFSANISNEQLPGTQPSDNTESASDYSLYLIVTSGNTTYQPFLLDRDDVLTITRGEDMVNRIHVTPESIWMESATCENQDCVDQGIVTADNRDSRVLDNMIICLPHQLQLYLFTADELSEMGLIDKTNDP